MTLRVRKLPPPTPWDPGPAHLSVYLPRGAGEPLQGVEVLPAALARMASGESEGLRGVGKTSRVSRGGEEATAGWEQQHRS